MPFWQRLILPLPNCEFSRCTNEAAKEPLHLAKEDVSEVVSFLAIVANIGFAEEKQNLTGAAVYQSQYPALCLNAIETIR
jgi:hypothetical protein